MTRAFILLITALLIGAPAAAQSDAWCRLYDFTQSQHGWSLSHTGEYGRYMPGRGFAVSSAMSSSYALARSIRLHLDWSGTLTDLHFKIHFPMFKHFLVDYDSEVTGYATSDVFEVAPARSDVHLGFDDATVTDRLGVELTSDVTDISLVSVLTAITVCGTGAAAPGGTMAELPLTLPVEEMFTAIATAGAAIHSSPDSLYAPGGEQLLPAEDGAMLFGYVKWLISPATADQLFGPFAPVFQHLGLGLTLMFTMVALYIALYIVVYGIRFVIWLIHWFLRFLDIVLQIAQAGGSVLLRAADAVLSFVRG